MSVPVLLGEPLRIGRHELRNRVVSPPMERNYGTSDGRATDRYVDYVRARAAALPSKPEFGRLLDWYAAELSRLEVDVRLSTAAEPETVACYAPDVLVMAVGGTGRLPEAAGITRSRVVDVRDWLRRPEPIGDDAVVTVWGADRAGVAVADAIAAAGHRVLLLGSGDELAPEAGPREKVLMVRRLTNNPEVEIRLVTTLEAIEDERLLLGHDGHRQWRDVSGQVLVSQGTRPRRIRAAPGGWRSVVVGEAAQATSAVEAIRQGAAISF